MFVGVTSAVQVEIFKCLSNWLIAGEISASTLARTPLLGFAFQALASEDLFDVAVDVICDIIHETQEIDENTDIIEIIVPKVIELRPLLAQYNDDPEKIRGLARIFAEAGETYRVLILAHTETFAPLVEAIGQCSAYPDLDIVPITFVFWMRLAQGIGKKSSVSLLFHDAYRTLMGIVIRHLHFPNEAASTTNQEAENFRHFRHLMGDTLKDCCIVLGTENCLMTAYGMVTSALSRDPSSLSWQEIEAPLFAMRSMGAEIDVEDDKVIPQIMDLIPSLPDHPKIQYATLLIIARYTEWTNKHPDYLPNQLQYISAGFNSADQDVNMAAGQALKYACQDCKKVSCFQLLYKQYSHGKTAFGELLTSIAQFCVLYWIKTCARRKSSSLRRHCACYFCDEHGTSGSITSYVCSGHSVYRPRCGSKTCNCFKRGIPGFMLCVLKIHPSVIFSSITT